MKRALLGMAALAVCSAFLFAATAKGKGARDVKRADAPEFVRVDCGGFRMGNEVEFEAEHEAWVSEFYICTHEVTQKEYQRIMGENPSECKGKNRPVESVSWFDAVEYCNKRSIAEGLTPCYTENYEFDPGANGYRLPTEAEWEYAARGGSTSAGFTYSGSDTVDRVAWYGENSGGKPHEVMTKAPNELGLYDMSGNVLEWCWDWYGLYTSGRKVVDPAGPAYGEVRILRGGYFSSTEPFYCTSTTRTCDYPAVHNPSVGFRVVRSGPRG